MHKKDVIKLALSGLAIGTMTTGCSSDSNNKDPSSSSELQQHSCSGKTSCKGASGCGSENQS